MAEVWTYCGTAGSNENWTWYVRLNATTDTAIATVSSTNNERRWTNTALNLTVAAGDSIEIKNVTPSWGTAVTQCQMSGYLLVE